MNTDIQPARHWPCSNAEYHADTKSISHSALEVFRESPELYHGRYLLGKWPREKSATMDLGTVAHTALLEPGSLPAVAIEIPMSALSASGARQGGQWKVWSEVHSHLIQLKAEEWDAVSAMIESVQQHPRAKAILDMPGQREHSIVWQDHLTGLSLKCRVDVYTDVLLADFKTTRDVRTKAFATAAVNLGYHRQAAFYRYGAAAMTGNWLPFVFIAVRNCPPYSCEVYELDAAFVELGNTQNRRLLDELAACRDCGDWKTDTWGEIVSLSCPRWALDESNWELSK